MSDPGNVSQSYTMHLDWDKIPADRYFMERKQNLTWHNSVRLDQICIIQRNGSTAKMAITVRYYKWLDYCTCHVHSAIPFIPTVVLEE